jgi:uncharacterized membrane protein
MAALITPFFVATPDTARSSGPSPEVTVRESVYDFETLLEGGEAVHTFVVENTGGAPFVIERIKTTCGCTTADYTRGEIAPGAEGEVTLKVNTKGYGGRKITKVATLVTDDPQIAPVKLRMTGKVAVFADIEPESIKLEGSPDETVRATVKIEPTETYPFHIVGEPENGKGNCSYTLEEKNGVYLLTAENLVTADKVYFDTVVLKTDHPENPEIEIRVLGKIKTETRDAKGR